MVTLSLSLSAHNWSQIRPENLDRGRGVGASFTLSSAARDKTNGCPRVPIGGRAGSGGPPTPSSSPRYCGQDAASRRRLCHMPTTLRYTCLALLPQLPTWLRVDLFLLPSAVPKPPRLLLLLEVKLVHTVESKSWFKQGKKVGKL